MDSATIGPKKGMKTLMRTTRLRFGRPRRTAVIAGQKKKTP